MPTSFTRRGLMSLVTVFVIAVFAAWNTPVRAQDDGAERRHAYWVFVEPGTGAADHLSPEARERRERRGVMRRDVEVPSRYVAALEAVGARPRVVSRWLQAVSVEASPAQIADVAVLPFVREVRPVAVSDPAAASDTPIAPLLLDEHDPWAAPFPARDQLDVINALAPLARGIDGSGVRLGFLDCTYGYFHHTVFDSLTASGRLLEVRNFAGRDQSCTHGLSVASVAVGYEEGVLMGPAHGASVLGAITEYGPTETRAEEDYFVAGLEWLESEGADVVNVSLGYTTFDAGEGNYARSDLDGDTGVTTRAVDAAAARGVVVVVSAGNEACSSGPSYCWHYISTPADADSAIAVGAIGLDSTVASFSGRGPTADGRIKPDVVAPGRSVYQAVPSGFARRNGTSFSAPLVAGVVAQMLQVNPDLTPIEVRAILRETASQAANPDTLAGWGVVDAAAAVAEAEREATGADDLAPPQVFTLSVPYPNPFRTATQLTLTLPEPGRVRVEVVDVLGRLRHVVHDGVLDGERLHTLKVTGDGLEAGVYVLRVVSGAGVATRRLVHLR